MAGRARRGRGSKVLDVYSWMSEFVAPILFGLRLALALCSGRNRSRRLLVVFRRLSKNNLCKSKHGRMPLCCQIVRRRQASWQIFCVGKLRNYQLGITTPVITTILGLESTSRLSFLETSTYGHFVTYFFILFLTLLPFQRRGGAHDHNQIKRETFFVGVLRSI